jgi:hypothetical protein
MNACRRDIGTKKVIWRHSAGDDLANIPVLNLRRFYRSRRRVPNHSSLQQPVMTREHKQATKPPLDFPADDACICAVKRKKPHLFFLALGFFPSVSLCYCTIDTYTVPRLLTAVASHH